MPVSEARRHADLAARALVKRGQSLGYKWEVGQHLDGEMLAAAQASKVAD